MYGTGMQEEDWISCRDTMVRMWEYFEQEGSFPVPRDPWKMVVTASLISPTYWTPYNLIAWREVQGSIPVCVEFSPDMREARGAIVTVVDRMGDPRSIQRIITRGTQRGIVDTMSFTHGKLSMLTQADVFAVIELLSVHVTAKA